MKIDAKQLGEIEQFDRVNLIHSLVGYKTPVLIGTKADYENVAVFSSVFHLGSNPPLLGIKFRPITEHHHTYKNIQNTGELTLNLVEKSFYQSAHLTSARVAESNSEFDFADLPVMYRDDIPVPFVASAKIQIHASYVEEYTITANNTVVMVVKVEQVFVPEDLIADNKAILLDKAGVVAINGLYQYYEAKKLEKLSYVHAPKKKGIGFSGEIRKK